MVKIDVAITLESVEDGMFNAMAESGKLGKPTMTFLKVERTVHVMYLVGLRPMRRNFAAWLGSIDSNPLIGPQVDGFGTRRLRRK